MTGPIAFKGADWWDQHQLKVDNLENIRMKIEQMKIKLYWFDIDCNDNDEFFESSMDNCNESKASVDTIGDPNAFKCQKCFRIFDYVE